MIADNRFAENAGWDDDLLRSELAALREAEFDLDLNGFDETELDEIMAGFEGFGMGGDEGDADGSFGGGNSPAPTPSVVEARRTLRHPALRGFRGKQRLLAGSQARLTGSGYPLQPSLL